MFIIMFDTIMFICRVEFLEGLKRGQKHKRSVDTV